MWVYNTQHLRKHMKVAAASFWAGHDDDTHRSSSYGLVIKKKKKKNQPEEQSYLYIHVVAPREVPVPSGYG